MSKKKVVAVIVEGPSDAAALGSIFKAHFDADEVQFVVVRGDITADDYSTIDNVCAKIGLLIDELNERYGYGDSDFLRIIHISDMDGAFTRNKVVHADVEKVQYYEDHIEAKNVDAINRRNEKKSDVLFKLRTTGKIHGIYYRIYFNSCNLEHVLFNALQDFTNEEKEEMADDFAEKYEDDLKAFIEFISSDSVAVPGTYKETWKYIEKAEHSLERNTNMHLIFK